MEAKSREVYDLMNSQALELSKEFTCSPEQASRMLWMGVPFARAKEVLAVIEKANSPRYDALFDSVIKVLWDGLGIAAQEILDKINKK